MNMEKDLTAGFGNVRDTKIQQGGRGAIPCQVGTAGSASTMIDKPSHYQLGSIKSRIAVRTMLERTRTEQRETIILVKIEHIGHDGKNLCPHVQEFRGKWSNKIVHVGWRQFVRPGNFPIGSLESLAAARMRHAYLKANSRLVRMISSIPRPGTDNSRVYFGELQKGDANTFGQQVYLPHVWVKPGEAVSTCLDCGTRFGKQASTSVWSDSKRTA
jgi:hypothetical protein